MPAPRLSAVIAITPAGVIGDEGDMPWRLSSDLRRFKRLTMGGVLIMGRRTFDSIGRPLPGRTTIVITRNRQWSAEGVQAVGSPEEAVAAAGSEPAFVVGGAEIYRQLIGRCGQLFLTQVWSDVGGQTQLELDLQPFTIIERCRVPATLRDEVPTEFLRLVRKKSGEIGGTSPLEQKGGRSL